MGKKCYPCFIKKNEANHENEIADELASEAIKTYFTHILDIIIFVEKF